MVIAPLLTTPHSRCGIGAICYDDPTLWVAAPDPKIAAGITQILLNVVTEWIHRNGIAASSESETRWIRKEGVLPMSYPRKSVLLRGGRGCGPPPPSTLFTGGHSYSHPWALG